MFDHVTLLKIYLRSLKAFTCTGENGCFGCIWIKTNNVFRNIIFRGKLSTGFEIYIKKHNIKYCLFHAKYGNIFST